MYFITLPTNLHVIIHWFSVINVCPVSFIQYSCFIILSWLSRVHIVKGLLAGAGEAFTGQLDRADTELE